MSEVQKAAMVVVRDCLAIESSEDVLIIVDERTRDMGMAILDAAKSLGAETILLEMAERKEHGSEPPRPVAAAMKAADVVIAPTSKSLSHTQARVEACRNGTRFASMPTITVEILGRTLLADYGKIEKRSSFLKELLSRGQEVRLTTAAGTDLVFCIAGRMAIADTGILHEKGSMGNLPAGEALIAPVEGKTNGVLVVDGTIAGIGAVSSPIRAVVRDGYLAEITGGREADALIRMLKDKGNEARNIAELGIGTNEKAAMSGNALEDEKVMGTVHVGIGDNSTIGGVIKAPFHLDCILKAPTLSIDGITVISDGIHLLAAEFVDDHRCPPEGNEH